MPMPVIDGQLNATEREVLAHAVAGADIPPKVVLEVGTWLGGGSTLHFLRALEARGSGHLWGIEAERGVYESMVENLQTAAPEAYHRFTPKFGFSEEVIPALISEQGPDFRVDVAFLDGGNNPGEQISEFKMLDPVIPLGGCLLSHDAKLRKGKWLVPYVRLLDNWESEVLDISEQGMFRARKLRERPSDASAHRASALLFKLRLEPAEIAAAILPASVCAFVLNRLPTRVARRLANGI